MIFPTPPEMHNNTPKKAINKQIPGRIPKLTDRSGYPFPTAAIERNNKPRNPYPNKLIPPPHKSSLSSLKFIINSSNNLFIWIFYMQLVYCRRSIFRRKIFISSNSIKFTPYINYIAVLKI